MPPPAIPWLLTRSRVLYRWRRRTRAHQIRSKKRRSIQVESRHEGPVARGAARDWAGACQIFRPPGWASERAANSPGSTPLRGYDVVADTLDNSLAQLLDRSVCLGTTQVIERD